MPRLRISPDDLGSTLQVDLSGESLTMIAGRLGLKIVICVARSVLGR